MLSRAVGVGVTMEVDNLQSRSYGSLKTASTTTTSAPATRTKIMGFAINLTFKCQFNLSRNPKN